MQLSEWLKAKGIKRQDFAARIGVSPQTITGYCKGSFWASKKRAELIFKETEGAVTPTDLMRAEDAQ